MRQSPATGSGKGRRFTESPVCMMASGKCGLRTFAVIGLQLYRMPNVTGIRVVKTWGSTHNGTLIPYKTSIPGHFPNAPFRRNQNLALKILGTQRHDSSAANTPNNPMNLSNITKTLRRL